MRVGVTGGTGFIGQYLIRDYSRKFDFIVPVRNIESISANKTNANYVESDFSVDSLKKIFKDCDAVIHLAAKVMPKKNELLKMEDYVQNIECSAHVFEACKDIGIKNVICASTRAVWSESALDGNMVLDESVQPAPKDEYGVSKLCVETLAHFYQQVYGMNISIYRMPEVCGIDLTRGVLNPFWAVVLNSAIQKRPIPIYGKGISGRDLIYVKDVVRALIVGLEAGKAGIFNIGSGHITTNIEIAKAFCEVFHDTAGIELHPEKKEWGTTMCLAVEKAKRELDYKAAYDLMALVQDIKEEYSQYNF